MKKGLLKALLIVVVILCLAAPVIAEGGFFSKIFSWLDFFFTGSPSGAQTFDLGVIASISPDSLAQGAVAPVRFYGSFVNETVSIASPLVLLNQTIVNNSVIEAWVSVPVFAAVGSYGVIVGSNSLSLNVTDGPLDFSSVVYSPNSSVSNSTVKFRAEISVAPFVNRAQVSITGGSLVLKGYNGTVVLNLANVDDSENGFVLSFDEYVFESADYFSPVLKLNLNFVESFSPAVQLDEEFALPAFLVQTYPALCFAVVPPMLPPFVPPFGCPPVFPFGPGLVPTGNDLVTHLPDPGGGTAPATAYCRYGTLCTVANPPWNPVVEVCDMDYAGPIGAPCPPNPVVVPPWASACMPPYNPGRCMPAQYICAGLGGAYPMFTSFLFPVNPWPLGSLTCPAPAVNVCGNGILEGPPPLGPEYCDDGEFPPVDCTNGCDSDCTPSECTDFIVCAPETCDPPGNNFQCAGGAVCPATCHCPVAPVVPKSGGGKSGSFSAKKCYPIPDICEQLDALAENEISPFELRTWAVASFAPGGADLSNPETDTQFPSFQACWDQNIGPQMFGSDQQYLDTFTKVGADGLRRWVKLPASYPSGDAAKYYEKQEEFKNKLSDRAGSFGVVDESSDLCAPAGPHIIAVSQAKCEVSDGTVKVYWSRGWMHNWRQEIDRMDFLSTGYVMTAEGFDAKILVSSGSRPDLAISDVGDGVVDGRTDKCKADANNCLETVKKEFKFVPGWSLSLKAVAQDSQKKKDMKSVVLTNDDCTSCPLYVELLDETGKMRNYENPCCDPESNVPAVCCDANLKFLQGLLLAKETGQCYLMSDAFDGPLKSVCLGGQNVCDIMSPGYLRDNSRAIYNQFYWKPMGIDCQVPFNPFRQSFSGSAFENAAGACPLPPPECEDGQMKRVGSDVGVCKPTIMECVDAHWVVISKGVGPGMELCNGKDDDCNDWVDDTLLCECRKGATQPCFDDAPMPVQTCEKRRAHYYWDGSQCIRDKEEPDVLVAPVGDSFAVQTVSGLGVPCGDDKFACCIIFDKQTEGDVVFEETVSVIPEGYVPVGSYNVQNCDAGDVDIAMNIKPVDSAVAVFKRADVEKRLPVGLKTTLDCAGFDYQKLADKSAIPDISLIEISEGVVLSEEFKELSAMGIKAEFAGDIDGVKVSLKNADVKISNKALSTLGAPLEMEFERRSGINVRISAPLVLKTNMDVNSLGFYVLQNAEWKYLGGSVEGGSFAVELEDIAQYSPFVFMIAGSKCLGCEQAYLSLARDVDSSILVVLVHGFMSAPDRAWSAFLKQFEDEQVAVDVAVFGYQGMKPADAAAVLSSRMHELSVDYDKIVFIAHSLGGLITQEFINNELNREDSVIPKIDAVITAGTPYSGTVVAKTGESLFDIFALLLDNQDHAPMFGIHRETLEFMQSGLPYSFPPEIKAFSLVGTRDLLGIGSSLGLSEPNDVLVEAVSAKKGNIYSKKCVDELEHYENHFQLNKAPEERYTLLYFLRELSSEFSQRAPPKMYAMLRIDDCMPGEIIVYGRPVNPKEFPPPKGCEQLSCGDGVCQFSENVKNCELDCKSPEKEYAADVCSMSGLALNVLLGLSVLLIVVYALHPASFLLYSVYGLSGMSLGGLIGNFALCGSLPVIPMAVFGLVLLMLLINYYVRFLPRFYRWH